MKRSLLKSMSLKTKVALVISALFVIFVTTAFYFTLSYFERKFKEAISTQQFSLVSALADTIDDKLRISQKALLAVAATAPGDAISNADNAQRFLNANTGLQSLFDFNTFFISLDGKLVAESRYVSGRRGKDLSFREWVQKTIATRKPYISDPFISTHGNNHLVLTMTAPVFDRQGNMTGLLGGSFDLMGGNILSELSKTRIGNGGYIYLSNEKRTMITHPDKARIMKPAAAPGINKLYDRAINGFEGSGETVTSYGIPMLSSCKHLRMTSWILVANYPVSEAYAPLEKTRSFIGKATLAATIILLLITWIIMDRLMSSLQSITCHMRHLTKKTGKERLIPVVSTDEIGDMAMTFNVMLNTLDSQQEELKEQNSKIEDERAFLQTLLNTIPDMIFFKDRNSVYLGCNDACASVFMGLPRERIKGHTDYDFLPTVEFAEFYRKKDLETMESGELNIYEKCLYSVDGRHIMVETLKVPFRDALGNIAGIIGVCRDVTERNRAEEKLHEQALQLENEIAERQKAQEELTARKVMLEELNRMLEERISKAVAELRGKDQMLIQQSRHAALGEMINNIAHQWRQPLNNIGLIVQNLQLIYQMGQLDLEEMNSQCDSAMETILFMSRTIDDFRNYFRQDKEKELFNVDQVVARTISIIEGSLKKHQIVIEINVTDDPVIHGYPNEYSQALLNILLNARDVLSERRIGKPRVMIDIRAENAKAVVIITDNAGGIPEDVIDKVFDPYFTTKGPDKGTGVGLFMSKEIIEKSMDGCLTTRNTGNGAEFRIEV